MFLSIRSAEEHFSTYSNISDVNIFHKILKLEQFLIRLPTFQGPILLDINLISHFIQREGQRDINRGKQRKKIGWQRALERDRKINRGEERGEENGSYGRRETKGVKGGSAGHHGKVHSQ